MSPFLFVHTLWRQRDLWWQFTVRAVEMRHRGSYLGVLWTVLNPLLMLAMYVTVFGLIFKSRFHAFPDETSADYALGVFVGLILFHVFSETVAGAPGFVVNNPNLVKKVVFPLEILPLANVSALWFHFFVSFVLLICATLVAGRIPTLAGLAWIPLILAPHILLTIGAGWLIAALGVFFRDIAQLVGFVTQVILYASAVFYPAFKIQEQSHALWSVLKWNPLLQTVDLARKALLWQQPVDPVRLGYTWAAGAAVFFIGAWTFQKLKPAFADVI
jgi:lipopolysaccharide transport system permease protein